MDIRKRVWPSAEEMPGHPPEIWRKDHVGNSMNFQEYLNPACNHGWEIVYVKPIEAGGADEIANMRAQNLRVNYPNLDN
ncbi:MAG: hypothetical protein KDC11_14260 [Chitinophagaceae bacterium]|nr:hypothetical protein [Chitinophagaceae bacterium]